MIEMTSNERKKELDRVFRFIIKNRDNQMMWENADIRNFIRWAMKNDRLFLIRKDKQIVALSIVWRTDHPENKFRNLDNLEYTEMGDYLCIFEAIVHKYYRKKGLLLQLMYMWEQRYPDTRMSFWIDRRGHLRIIETKRLAKELYKWAAYFEKLQKSSK